MSRLQGSVVKNPIFVYSSGDAKTPDSHELPRTRVPELRPTKATPVTSGKDAMVKLHNRRATRIRAVAVHQTVSRSETLLRSLRMLAVSELVL